MSGVIEGFARDVSGRQPVKEIFGFDPTAIVGIITMLMDLLEGCKQDASRLREFAEGKRSIGQLVTLRRKCVDEARAAGASNPLRAGRALSDAVLAELSDATGRMSGDVYQQAIDEAASVG
jgi:hypothetical protein